MKVHYQKSGKNDVLTMFSLLQQIREDQHVVSFAGATHPDEVEAWLNEHGSYFYLATSGEHAVGLMRAQRGTDDTFHSAQISIAVSPDFRKMGIAKSLLLYGLADLKGEGVTIARALVFSHNKASLNTMLSAGFSISGTIYKHHFHPELSMYVDDVIFFKEL